VIRTTFDTDGTLFLIFAATLAPSVFGVLAGAAVGVATVVGDAGDDVDGLPPAGSFDASSAELQALTPVRLSARTAPTTYALTLPSFL
jgi:hypothetical protein